MAGSGPRISAYRKSMVHGRTAAKLFSGQCHCDILVLRAENYSQTNQPLLLTCSCTAFQYCGAMLPMLPIITGNLFETTRQFNFLPCLVCHLFFKRTKQFCVRSSVN